jgi:hypothetical protein
MIRMKSPSAAALTATLLVSLVWLGCTTEQGGPLSPGDTAALEQAPQNETVFELQDAAVQAAVRAQEGVTRGLMAVPGVVGTGVGIGSNGQPVVKVLLSSPGAALLPSAINGVPVEPLITGEIFALQDARARQDASVEPRARPTCGKKNLPPCPDDPGAGPDLTERHPRPVPIGVSTGHPAITAGTLGARVTDGTSVWALSNNHVYADENAATNRDDLIQPGTFDGGSSPADDIGTLDDYEPIVFGGVCVNVIDAAIAATTTAKDGKGKTRLDDRRPVGLLFAGSSSITVVNPIDAVLTRFGVTIDGN